MSTVVTALRARMIQDLQLAGLSERTQEAYVRSVRKLAEHYGQAPEPPVAGRWSSAAMFRLPVVRLLAPGAKPHENPGAINDRQLLDFAPSKAAPALRRAGETGSIAPRWPSVAIFLRRKMPPQLFPAPRAGRLRDQ